MDAGSTVRTQDQYGVNYLKYWGDEQAGKVFCLVEALTPTPRCSCTTNAHGHVADHIDQVEDGS